MRKTERRKSIARHATQRAAVMETGLYALELQ